MFNFYQSSLRKHINKYIYKKTTFTQKVGKREYFGIRKEYTKLGKTFFRSMIHGIHIGDITQIQKDIAQDMNHIQRDHGKDIGSICFQFGFIDIIGKYTKKDIKSSQTLQTIRQRYNHIHHNMKKRYKLTPSIREHMPSASLILDIRDERLPIRQNFSNTCKRFLKKASNAGLEFHRSSPQDREKFWDIRHTVSYDKGFSIIDKQTFINLMSYLLKTNQGDLFLSKQGKHIVSGSVILFFKQHKHIVYLYGASSRKYATLGGHYFLNYEIMKRGNRHGYHFFDMLGISPPGQEATHPLGGVSRFKKSFGGTILLYCGNYDLVFNPRLYNARGVKKYGIKFIRNALNKQFSQK